MLCRYAGADDIDAVEARLFGDVLGTALEREMAVADIDVEVLGHFLFVDDGADRQADLGGALEASGPTTGLLLDPAELPFGRGQQLFALAGALAGKISVTADDRPFPREQIGRADLGEIAIIEQRQL